MAADVSDLLRDLVADAQTHWSMGTFGAIGEFMRDPGEIADITAFADGFSAVTARGGVCVRPVDGLRPLAYETPSADGQGWSHALALCLPHDQCAMRGNQVLTELGADTQALRAGDRTSILFNLGLGALQVDMCIRTGDPELIALLRDAAGQTVFSGENPAMPAIMRASPNRVFLTRLGRLEVFQPIPPPDGRSPEGPHTHLLPRLLRSGRTHAATTPIPTGWIPCAHAFPPHPLKRHPELTPAFDAAIHADFQRLLQRFGVPELCALKQSIVEKVRSGAGPQDIPPMDSKFSRAVLRLTIRQLHFSHPGLLSDDWLTLSSKPPVGPTFEDDDDEQPPHSPN